MIYYGDEVGLVGENDPDCRGTMPWDESVWRVDILGSVRDATAARAAEPLLRRGAQRVVALAADVVAIVRFDESRAIATIVNRAQVAVTVDPSALDAALESTAAKDVSGDWSGAAASALKVPAAGTVVVVKGAPA